jgi:hypothetical protein
MEPLHIWLALIAVTQLLLCVTALAIARRLAAQILGLDRLLFSIQKEVADLREEHGPRDFTQFMNGGAR